MTFSSREPYHARRVALARPSFTVGILLALWAPLPAAAQPAPATDATDATATVAPAGGQGAQTDVPAGEARAPAAESPAPEPPKTIDVSVGGEKPPGGSSALRRRDIREMPGALADPYRAIEVKPGVTPTASGFPYFFIRGAPPGNIGYFFDGIQVPLLFHVGGGPSVVPAPLVQKVMFHPGPYPASHGRFAGAIIEATSAPPPLEWKAEAGLRLDIGGVVQGPINDRVDVLAGGHWAYGAAILSAVVPTVGVGYGDYQARIGYKLSTTERVRLFGFGSYDYLALNQTTDAGLVKTTLLDADFHRVDLQYEKDIDGGGRVFGAVTLGLDQSRNVGVRSAQQYKLAARGGIERPIWGGAATLRAGLDASLDQFRVLQCLEIEPTDRCAPGDEKEGRDKLAEAFRTLFPERLDFTIGGYTELSLRLGERSELVPGLRVDLYHSLGDTDVAIDPKLSGRFVVHPQVALVPAVGLASQRAGFAPLPALVIGGLDGGLQRSLQASFGAEARLGPMEVVAAVFRQATFGLTDAVGTGRGTDLDTDRFKNRSVGDTYGLEVGAQGALRRDLLFVLSYTLSRATRQVDGRTIPSAYDRTHVAQLALLYDFGGGFRGGFRHVFYSGFPADEVGPGREPSENPKRVRPFYRVDARLSKRWTVGKRGWVSLVLDVQNATLSKEVFDVQCDAQRCTPQVIGPVSIPALALEAGY